MRLFGSIFLMAAMNATALQDAPAPLKMPGVFGGKQPGPAVNAEKDIIHLYRDRREAATAAYLTGYRLATGGGTRGAAMAMFLVAVKRDPTFGKAHYNLGLLCALQDRWQDALDFYREAQQTNPDPNTSKLLDGEIARVRAIQKLESSPEGKKSRQFAFAFAELLAHRADAPVALDRAQTLAKQEPGHWETLALIGELQAMLGHYGEAGTSLEASVKIAPQEKQSGLTRSLELARSENSFLELMRKAQENWQAQKFTEAAQLFSSAWNASPSRTEVGMQAAVGYLMADQIKPAVEVLARLRNSPNAAHRARAVAMLAELGVLSDEAKRQTALGEGTQKEAEQIDIVKQMETWIGPLMSNEARLVTGVVARFLNESATVTPIPDLEIQGPKSDLLLTSTQSVFGLYKESLNTGAPKPPEAEAAPRTTMPPTVPPAPQPMAQI